MCPAIPKRKKNVPYAPQAQLKKPRTHAVLRRYAKRRAEYAAMQSLCFLTFYLYFHQTLWQLWRDEVKAAARPGTKRRVRRFRKRKKILARIYRIQEQRTKLREQIATLQERIRLKAFYLRRQATQQHGFSEGWTAVVPKTEAELKALSFSGRFIVAYLGAVTERQRVNMVVTKQNKPAAPRPVTIKL